MEKRAGGGSKNKAPLNRSLSNSDVGGGIEKTDGSLSDSAVSSSVTEGRKRRPSLGYKVAALVGLSRKSSSTSQLSSSSKSGKSQFDKHLYNPSNTKHLYTIYTMLDQRRRRCVDVV